MKVRVSSVIMFQLVVLTGVVLMLFQALDVLPELTWPDTQDAMAARLVAALLVLGVAAWIVVRGSRARKKAETLRLERTCAINQS